MGSWLGLCVWSKRGGRETRELEGEEVFLGELKGVEGHILFGLLCFSKMITGALFFFLYAGVAHQFEVHASCPHSLPRLSFVQDAKVRTLQREVDALTELTKSIEATWPSTGATHGQLKPEAKGPRWYLGP